LKIADYALLNKANYNAVFKGTVTGSLSSKVQWWKLLDHPLHTFLTFWLPSQIVWTT